ncbi:unnamed protein product, partial [Didymodactylos carnosus]
PIKKKMNELEESDPSTLHLNFAMSSNHNDNKRYLNHSIVAIYTKNVKETEILFDNIKDKYQSPVVICYESGVARNERKSRLKAIQSFIAAADDNHIYSRLKNWIFFTKSDKYHNYVKSVSTKNIIIIILSRSLSTDLLLLQMIKHPHIYLRSQLKQIYGLHLTHERHTKRLWIAGQKEIHYFTDKNVLYSKLTENITEYTDRDVIVENDNSQMSLRDAKKIKFEILTIVISQIKQTYESKQEMLAECRSYYNHEKDRNEAQLKMIDQFEREYISDRAIYWFTRNCFLYRIVNYVGRTENIDLLYSLRYYISDLQRQLEQLHLTSPVVTPLVVYRGQVMDRNELEEYKYNIGNYYATNTFMSTTRSQDVALTFAGDEYSDKERVLFYMTIDTHENMPSFASIKYISAMPDEDEILLSIGFTFKINSVQKSTTSNIWIIKMVAAADIDYMTAKMKKEFHQFHIDIQTVPSLLMIGNLLLQMDEVEKAEQYYRMFIETESLPNSTHLINAYKGIGHACIKQCQYSTALENYELAIRICLEHFDGDKHSLIRINYQNIADVYLSMFDYKSAINYYEKMLAFIKYEQSIPYRRQLECITYHRIALAYTRQKNYLTAIDYHKRSVHLQLTHGSYDWLLSGTYYLLGSTYELNDEYKLAKDFYEKAYEIERNEIYYEYVIKVEHKIKEKAEKIRKKIKEFSWAIIVGVIFASCMLCLMALMIRYVPSNVIITFYVLLFTLSVILVIFVFLYDELHSSDDYIESVINHSSNLGLLNYYAISSLIMLLSR